MTSEELHDIVLMLAIVVSAAVVVVALFTAKARKGDHWLWLRILSALGALALCATWLSQMTGYLDLGAISQSIALPGVILILVLQAIFLWKD